VFLLTQLGPELLRPHEPLSVKVWGHKSWTFTDDLHGMVQVPVYNLLQVITCFAVMPSALLSARPSLIPRIKP